MSANNRCLSLSSISYQHQLRSSKPVRTKSKSSTSVVNTVPWCPLECHGPRAMELHGQLRNSMEYSMHLHGMWSSLRILRALHGCFHGIFHGIHNTFHGFGGIPPNILSFTCHVSWIFNTISYSFSCERVKLASHSFCPVCSIMTEPTRLNNDTGTKVRLKISSRANTPSLPRPALNLTR